jgi:serine phosphatase RsbU (regulator of sigma subunit)
VNAQDKNYGYPFIQNFTSKEFVLENLSWGSVQDAYGNMYYGNGSGLLKYDGNKWSVIERIAGISICYDSLLKTVFVGSIDNFGYISINSDGKSHYVSLSDKISQNQKIGYVWDCFSTKDGVFFLTEEKLFRYKNGTFKVWNSQSKFHAAYGIDNTVFIREVGTGLLCIEGDMMTYVKGSDVFADNRVEFIGKDNQKKNEYTLYSREKGLNKFNLIKDEAGLSMQLNPLNKNISQFLSNNVVYRGVVLKNNQIAFSTLLGGLIIIDQNGNLISNLNKQNGLNCDVINHTFEDNQGNLWLSTENGISLVMYSLPTYAFNKSGNISGNAVSTIKFNNTIYVATSTGIYAFNNIKNQFEKIDFPTIQVWYFTITNNNKTLLASTAKGIYEITNNGSRLLCADYENVFTIFKSKVKHNLYYASHFNGVFAFTYDNGVFNLKGEITNLNSAILLIYEDKKGNLLLSSQNDGIFYAETSKINFNDKKNYVNLVHFTDESGLPDMHYNFVSEINGELIISTLTGLYHFVQNVDISNLNLKEISALKFEKYEKLNPFKNNEDVQIHNALKQDDAGNLYLTGTLNNGSHTNATYIKAKNKWTFQPFSIISKEKINDIFPDINQDWYCGTDVIYCLNKSNTYNYNYAYNSIINTVISNADTAFMGNYFSPFKVGSQTFNQLSLVQPEELVKSFDYLYNDFTFHFSATSFIADIPSKFSCYLEGEDEKWSEWTSESSKIYMNLHEGTYIFKVKARNIFGNESSVASYEFVIHPPWYRTTLAYILYFVLAFGFVYGVVVIFTRNLNRIIKKQTAELQQQKDEIVHKNKEITDSIYYAKRIQDAIMPSNEYIKNMFADSFVFFKPKDIVSGDFYWANLRENNAILTAVDCTGHGVPGAFMSMMGNDYLNDIIVDSKINEPNEILNRMRSGIIKALKQRGESGESKDGMDMALVNFDKTTLLLEYAGANNPLYIVRDKNQPVIENANLFSEQKATKNLFEIKGNKFPVGIHMGTTLQPFVKHQIQLVKGDVFYLFSDGFADQFGGPSAKKLKYNQFKKYILESMFLTMEEQKIYLEQKLNEWQGDLEQVDDVLVIGVRIV